MLLGFSKGVGAVGTGQKRTRAHYRIEVFRERGKVTARGVLVTDAAIVRDLVDAEHVQLALKDGVLVPISAWTADAGGVIEFDVNGEDAWLRLSGAPS